MGKPGIQARLVQQGLDAGRQAPYVLRPEGHRGLAVLEVSPEHGVVGGDDRRPRAERLVDRQGKPLGIIVPTGDNQRVRLLHEVEHAAVRDDPEELDPVPARQRRGQGAEPVGLPAADDLEPDRASPGAQPRHGRDGVADPLLRLDGSDVEQARAGAPRLLAGRRLGRIALVGPVPGNDLARVHAEPRQRLAGVGPVIGDPADARIVEQLAEPPELGETQEGIELEGIRELAHHPAIGLQPPADDAGQRPEDDQIRRVPVRHQPFEPGDVASRMGHRAHHRQAAGQRLLVPLGGQAADDRHFPELPPDAVELLEDVAMTVIGLLPGRPQAPVRLAEIAGVLHDHDPPSRRGTGETRSMAHVAAAGLSSRRDTGVSGETRARVSPA